MLPHGLFVIALLTGFAVVAGEGLREALRLARHGQWRGALARCAPAGFCLSLAALLVVFSFWAVSANTVR